MATRLDARAPGQIAEFHIRPDHDSRLYVLVRVFTTRARMYRFAQRTGTPGRDYAGICRGIHITSYRTGTAGVSLPIVCDILVPRTEMNLEVITHESTHAAIAFAFRKHRIKALTFGLSARDADPIEETICYTAGRLVNLIDMRWLPVLKRLRKTSPPKPCRKRARSAGNSDR
jgi:hypothetical protein